MSDLQVVSWDVDGTLYELPLMIRHVRRLALSRGLRSPARVARELWRLRRFRRTLECARRAGGSLSGVKLPDPRPSALEQRWYGEAIRQAGPRPGLAQVLEQLRAQGLRLVVLSDLPSAFKLEALGLTGLFERVYCGEELGQLKPSPLLFRHVLDDLNISPSSLLHVGDRPESDAACAGEVGFRAVILPPGPLALAQLLGNSG